jgi:hypothetical protein
MQHGDACAQGRRARTRPREILQGFATEGERKLRARLGAAQGFTDTLVKRDPEMPQELEVMAGMHTTMAGMAR